MAQFGIPGELSRAGGKGREENQGKREISVQKGESKDRLSLSLLTVGREKPNVGIFLWDAAPVSGLIKCHW